MQKKKQEVLHSFTALYKLSPFNTQTDTRSNLPLIATLGGHRKVMDL